MGLSESNAPIPLISTHVEPESTGDADGIAAKADVVSHPPARTSMAEEIIAAKVVLVQILRALPADVDVNPQVRYIFSPVFSFCKYGAGPGLPPESRHSVARVRPPFRLPIASECDFY